MNAWPALLALWATALATSPAQAVDGTARLCAAYAGKPAAASADPLPAGMVAPTKVARFESTGALHVVGVAGNYA